MIAALNLIVPIVVIGLFVLAMRLKKMYPIYIAVVFVILYQAFQPSYMPKGRVTTTLPNAEFQVTSGDVEDRLRKPMDSEARTSRMIEVEELATKRREELVNQIKTEKGVN